MAHAPHKVHTVFVNNAGAFMPEGADKKVLRAEVFNVTENGKIILTLSDYYADEYYVSMGPNTESMLSFVSLLTADKRFCELKAHVVNKKDGASFSKPIVKIVNKTFRSEYNEPATTGAELRRR